MLLCGHCVMNSPKFPAAAKKFPAGCAKIPCSFSGIDHEIAKIQSLRDIAAKIFPAGRESARRRWPMRLPQIFLLRRFHRGDALQVEDVVDRGDAALNLMDAAVAADCG